METRKVTIINSKTQSQKVIQNSRATTLGELKQEMSAQGIDYSGMTFFEGHMRAELKDDASSLPTNIPYKGELVNDLVFMLTVPDKKVKSGTMSRAEAYAEIKNRGLQQACVEKFGRNFTQCSTSDLLSLVSGFSEEKPVSKDEPRVDSNSSFRRVKTVLCDIIRALYLDDIIDKKLHDKLFAILSEEVDLADWNTESVPDEMSKEEISEMFDFVNR